METNEMIVLDEVVENTEEIVRTNSKNGLTTAAGIGIALLVGGIAYKKVIKPLLAKRKAKKEENNDLDEVSDDFEENDQEEVEIEDEE